MKNMATTLLLTLSLAAGAQAATVSGVEIPETFTADGSELKLNGAGVREKWFMDIYVGGLYLPETMNDAQAIIAADKPMSLKLHMVSGLITSEKMKDSTLEGFEKATGGNMQPIQEEIDKFIAVFDEEIQEGDEYDIVYLPATGVVVYKNGEQAGVVGGGLEFKKALFGIWLSDEPASEDLKAQMLGQAD